MINKNQITGIILAGGRSSRMGSDKGFLTFKSETFTEHIISALNPLVSEILIVSDNSDYDIFGLKRIKDKIKNAGPVSGIVSGLEASKTDYNLILSCDIPLITTKVLQQIIESYEEGFEIVQVESHGKSMPLIALYLKNVKETFKECLQLDERRLRIAVKNCAFKNVVLDKTLANNTQNINTVKDFNDFIHVNNN